MIKYFYFLFIFFLSSSIYSQNGCATLGQSPNSAFPICGTTVFSQSIVPFCAGRTIPVPACSDPLGTYADVRPFWYKFTCFTGGTLGFLIQPNSNNDDYDWQIFDITGKSPADVYTDPSLFVSCNWSSNGPQTGANSTGTRLNNCQGPSTSNISSMPTLIQVHNYLMMISNFSPSQAGYKLSFGGGTAGITDTLTPSLAMAVAACDGTKIGIKLNKKMKCSSLAANGSDFSINSNATSIIGAVGNNCSTGFDMDSIIITLNNPLPAANYIIAAKIGSDGNTILDNCDNGIAVGDTVNVIVYPNFPVPMDSIAKVGCGPQNLVLVFSKQMRCNSIAADGSDFIVTGPIATTITKAIGTCSSDGLTKNITVSLAQPITTAGIYTITLKSGTDGNTLLNECAKETPAGSALQFTTADTVNANFNYSIAYGCVTDTVNFRHMGNNGVNKWEWNFGDSRTSMLQNPSFIFLNTGTLNVQLKVDNGICFDSIAKPIVLDYDTIKAIFKVPEFICPNDVFTIENNSTGKIVSYNWDFGNGTRNTSQNPTNITYPTPTTEQKKYVVRLTVTNNIGCSSPATKNVTVLRSCYIAVPSAFTPNADGLNDFLHPLNAYKADNLLFRVYNRYGNIVFETTDWTRKWDGKINGILQPTGTFVWLLTFTDRDTKKQVLQKGTTVLIR